MRGWAATQLTRHGRIGTHDLTPRLFQTCASRVPDAFSATAAEHAERGAIAYHGASTAETRPHLSPCTHVSGASPAELSRNPASRIPNVWRQARTDPV